MKRVLILAIFSIMSICVSAQSVDSLKSAKICIDSLSTKLNKLQHDYDFLYISSEFERSISSLNLLRCEITDAVHAIRIEMCAHNFDVDLYISFKKQYDAHVSYRNTLMDKVKMTKEKYGLMVDSVEFSADQIFSLEIAIISIDNICNSFDAIFSYYKICLDKYKKMI